MEAKSSLPKMMRVFISNDGGTKVAFGRAVGLSSSDVSRILHQGAAPTVEVCLRIAAHMRVSPLPILRAAGHDEVAELLAATLPAPGPSPVRVIERRAITPAEERFVFEMRALSPGDRRAIRDIVGRAVRWQTAPVVSTDGASAEGPGRARRRRHDAQVG